MDYSYNSPNNNNNNNNISGNENYGATAPPPYSQQQYQSPSTSNNQSREQKFQEIVNKYEISQFYSGKLQKLNSFKIVFIFDDSGSMNSILEDSPLNTGLMKAKRWDELKYFSTISIDIANIFNPEGTDVYFLNRPMARSIRHPDELLPYFNASPNGYTPLARVLGTVLNNNSASFLREKSLLIIIVTDGEPTDDNGRVDIKNFKHMLKSRNKNVFTTIVSCTDDDSTMEYLNNWDRTIPRLDVVDDFRNERNEVKKYQGRDSSFSYGDYVVKSLIGSVDESIDRLDERGKSGQKCTLL